VAAPAITNGTLNAEYRLIMVISTAPTGKPDVIVSTVDEMKYTTYALWISLSFWI